MTLERSDKNESITADDLRPYMAVLFPPSALAAWQKAVAAGGLAVLAVLIVVDAPGAAARCYATIMVVLLGAAAMIVWWVLRGAALTLARDRVLTRRMVDTTDEMMNETLSRVARLSEQMRQDPRLAIAGQALADEMRNVWGDRAAERFGNSHLN